MDGFNTFWQWIYAEDLNVLYSTNPPVLVAEERKIIMAMPLFVFENNTQSFHQRSSYQIIKLQDAWWAAFEETWLINIMFALAHSSFF